MPPRPFARPVFIPALLPVAAVLLLVCPAAAQSDLECPPGRTVLATEVTGGVQMEACGALVEGAFVSDGPYRLVRPDSSVAETGSFAAGLKEGEIRTFFPGGSRKSSIVYANGLKHGPARGWLSGGQPYYETTFAGGLEQGRRVEWHSDRSVRLEGSFDAGQKVGTWIWYGRDGSVEREEVMVPGATTAPVPATGPGADPAAADAVRHAAAAQALGNLVDATALTTCGGVGGLQIKLLEKGIEQYDEGQQASVGTAAWLVAAIAGDPEMDEYPASIRVAATSIVAAFCEHTPDDDVERQLRAFCAAKGEYGGSCPDALRTRTQPEASTTAASDGDAGKPRKPSGPTRAVRKLVRKSGELGGAALPLIATGAVLAVVPPAIVAEETSQFTSGSDPNRRVQLEIVPLWPAAIVCEGVGLGLALGSWDRAADAAVKRRGRRAGVEEGVAVLGSMLAISGMSLHLGVGIGMHAEHRVTDDMVRVNMAGFGLYLGGVAIIELNALMLRKRAMRRGRAETTHTRLAPRFAGAWVSPVEGGVSGGFALLLP